MPHAWVRRPLLLFFVQVSLFALLMPKPSTSLSLIAPMLRVSRRGSKMRGQDNSISKINEERKENSGRKGSKNYVDPCKLFVGNLPYDANVEDVEGFFDEAGYKPHLMSVKVIKDWKTGESKGFGFALFSDAIFATAAMEGTRGRRIGERVVVLRQGSKKKEDPVAAFIEKDGRNDNELDEEEMVIREGLDMAEDEDSDMDYDDDLDGEDDDSYDGDFVAERPERFLGFGQYVDKDTEVPDLDEL